MTQTQTTNFVQYGVRLVGLVYIGLGVLGFLPLDFLNPFHHEGVGTRYLLNLVAVNTLHNLIHLTIGLSALWAARTLPGARLWGKIAGAVLLLLFIAGLGQAALEGFPKDQLLFRLVPLNSPGHTLHLMSGSLALYLGIAKLPSRPGYNIRSATANENFHVDASKRAGYRHWWRWFLPGRNHRRHILP